MRLHHVGVVVDDVESHATRWEALLGAKRVSEPIVDPRQSVRLLFLATGTDVEIELIEPIGPDSPVARALGRGGGPNHLCYEVRDFDAELERMSAAGCLIARAPEPAVAFEGRRVVFLYTRERQLVELVEAP